MLGMMLQIFEKDYDDRLPRLRIAVTAQDAETIAAEAVHVD